MAADFSIKANDRLPSIQAAFKEPDPTAPAGTLPTSPAYWRAVNLTTATSVEFIMKSAAGNTIKVNAVASIVSAASGTVRYDWAAVDTAVPGSYVAEWEVTWTGGKKQTFPTLTFHTIDVLADLDGA